MCQETGIYDDPTDQKQNQNKQDKAALQAGQLLPFLQAHAKQDGETKMQNHIGEFNIYHFTCTNRRRLNRAGFTQVDKSGTVILNIWFKCNLTLQYDCLRCLPFV